jgi:carboxypeptidase Taq
MTGPEKKLQELKIRLLEIGDLNHINALLNWDQSTYMPSGGAEARGRQSALLGQMAQEKFIDKKIGKLLDDLRPYEESLPYESDDASLIRVTRREYERSLKVPPKFIGELTEHGTTSYQAWTEARPANDFGKVRSNLEKTLDFSRKLADYFPGYEHIADPLIDFADYGMKASSVRALFANLRGDLSRSCARSPHSRQPTLLCFINIIPKRSSWLLARMSSRNLVMIFHAAASTRPIIPS